MAGTVGIIAEYNPFHNGHQYQIQKAKELTGADFCVIAMSGDFVQRGAPAIFDKYTRTHAALLCGADVVLELPPAFATSSAEDFAACGVALLDRLGVVDNLSFGSECGDLDSILGAAHALSQESEDFKQVLRAQLKAGHTFPQARIAALEADGLEADLLSAPNNILAVEYAKALMKRNSSIKPVTVLRQGSGYHEAGLSQTGLSQAGPSQEQDSDETPLFSSATAIRKTLCTADSPSADETGLLDSLDRHIPRPALPLLSQAVPVTSHDFSALLTHRLLECDNLADYLDCSEELAARIRTSALSFGSWEDRIADLKTRQYTYTRVSRALCHILLGITKEETAERKERDYISYGRILGFRREAQPLLAAIKKASAIPMITKTADASSILDSVSYRDFQRDAACSHLYQAVLAQKSRQPVLNEYNHPIVICSSVNS